jgi:hypothetical protein
MRYFLKTHDTCVIELKDTRGADSLPFKDVKEHQNTGLSTATEAEFTWKFDDVGYRRAPFDFIGVSHAYAFIAIRYHKGCTVIAHHVFEQEERTSRRKSLTWDRAKEIAFDVIY